MVQCSWCGQELYYNDFTYCKLEDDEKHSLCSSCHLSGHACQSSCPTCWHDFAQFLISRDSLCAGCTKPLDKGRNFDTKGHPLCIQCQNCILCSFREQTKKDFFTLSYREHEPRIQNILYLMQMCVQRIEIEREPCSICIEPLYNNDLNPVKTLDQCQHRFHSKCIEKWFKEKPCCPCCRHVYQDHDEPSCGMPLATDDNSRLCGYQHKLCSKCPSGNCNLCKFVQLRSMAHSNFESLPADWHPILNACFMLEQKFEELQRMSSDHWGQPSAGVTTDGNVNSAAPQTNAATDPCVICMEDRNSTSVLLPICQHTFHRACIEQWFQLSGKQTCPTCGYLYGISKGPQPALGEMRVNYLPTPLPGFTNEQYGIGEAPTIEITYTIPSGIQGPLNPHPGQPFTGTNRKAYLPNTQEGKYVLELLRRAFNDQHVFTI
ncbi:unnamed protein product, partial [Adineta ricciae]